MEKLIRKTKFIGLIKIIFAILLEVIVIYILKTTEDISLVEKMICFVLWSIAFIIYLISGIRNLKNSSRFVKQYIQNNEYTKEQLSEEFNNSKKFSKLYIGDIHVFVISSIGTHIIPINDIERISYTHSGENWVKGRPGYYYLYLRGDKIENNIKIYFASRLKLEQAMNYLIKVNDKIIKNSI